MNNELAIKIIESAITILKRDRKSDDIAELFRGVDVDGYTPSLLYDFFIEISLCANSEEEVGFGCYSIEHIEKALNEYKEKGSTELLDAPRGL